MYLQFEFLNSFFNLNGVFGLGNGSLPHAVRQQGEEALNHLKENKLLVH